MADENPAKRYTYKVHRDPVQVEIVRVDGRPLEPTDYIAKTLSELWALRALAENAPVLSRVVVVATLTENLASLTRASVALGVDVDELSAMANELTQGSMEMVQLLYSESKGNG